MFKGRCLTVRPLKDVLFYDLVFLVTCLCGCLTLFCRPQSRVHDLASCCRQIPSASGSIRERGRQYACEVGMRCQSWNFLSIARLCRGQVVQESGIWCSELSQWKRLVSRHGYKARHDCRTWKGRGCDTRRQFFVDWATRFVARLVLDDGTWAIQHSSFASTRRAQIDSRGFWY